ncbi:MAG TPA: alpha/beta hydrolase-fold protein [Thermoanaerobaculia bacterium]
MTGIARLVLSAAFVISAGSALAAPASAEGRVEERALGTRRLWVYTPPGYDAAARTAYDLLLVFDGEEYLEEIPLPKILDALVAEKNGPARVAVMIDDGAGAQRLADLANRVSFADYLGEEVLPFVRKNWNVTRDPHRVVVVGSSAGGLAAAFAAFRHPELFGVVLSQSGAFWRGAEASNDPPWEWLTAQYAAAPRKDVRFVLEVGARETRGALGGAAPSILDANRRLRDALAQKGYRLAYYEVPDGQHGPEWWKERLRPALQALAALEAPGTEKP